MDDFTVQAIALALSYTIAIALRAAGLVDNVLETTTTAYCITLPPTSLTLRDTPVISALLDSASLNPTRTPTAPPIALNFKTIPVPDLIDIRISPLARRLLINEDALERALLAQQRNEHAARIADEVATAWSSYEERLISRPSATKDAPWLQASPNGLASYIVLLIVLIMTVVVIYVRLFRRKPTRRFPAATAEVESGAPPAPPPSTSVDDEVDAAQQEIDDLLAEFRGPSSFEERIPYIEILPAPVVAVPAAPAPAPAPVTPVPAAPAPTAPAPVAPAPAALAPIVQAPVVQALPVAPAPAAPVPVAPATTVPAPVVAPSVRHAATPNPSIQSDEDEDDQDNDNDDDPPDSSPHIFDASSTSPTGHPSDSETPNDLADDPLPFAHDDCVFATDANEPALSDSAPIDVTNSVPRSTSSVSIHDDTIIVNLPSGPAEMSQPLPSIQPTTPLHEASVLPLNSARPEADVAFQPESTDASFFGIADESSTPVVSLPRAHRGDEVNVGLSPALPCVTAFNNAALQPSSVGDSFFGFLDETSPSASIVNLPRAIQVNEDDAGPSPIPQDVAAPSDDNADSSSDESEAENIDAHEMVSRIRGMFSLRLSNDSRRRQATRILVPISANPTASQDTDSTTSSPQLQTPLDLPVDGPAPLAATNEQLAQMLDNLRSKPASSSTASSIECSPSPAEESAPSAGSPSVDKSSHLDFLTSRLVQSAASTATQSYGGVNLLPILFPDPLPAEDAVALDVRGQEQDTGPTAEDDQQPMQALDETEPRESGAEEEDVVNVHVPDEEPSKASVEPSSSISESSSPLDEGTAPLTLPAIPCNTRQAHEVSQGAPQYGETLYIAIPRPSIARVPPHQARPQAPIIRPTPQQERTPASANRIAPPAPPLECPRYRCTSPSAAEVPNDVPSAVNFVWAQAPPYGIMRGSRLEELDEISQAMDMAIARVEASALATEAPAEAVTSTHPRIDDPQECEVPPGKVEMSVHSAEVLLQATPAAAGPRDNTAELPPPKATASEDVCTETASPADHVVAEPVPNSSETSTEPAPTTTTMPAHGRRKTRARGVKIVLQSNGPRNLGR